VKAVRVHDYKVDPSIDDIPEPELQGPLDVIIKIGGAGVCRTDLHIIDGDWAAIQDPTLPYVIGHENAGWVHAVGDAVTNVAVGDTVILHPQPSCGLCLACRAGRDMQCTGDAFFPGLSNNDGGMAEYLRTTARACVKLNPDTDPADVAALADAGITAYHAVRKAVPMLWPGTSAVVIGAGGLGHIGVQALAALTATKIIVVDKNPDALELAKQIGADETIVADGNQVGEVQELTGGGATVVFDFVAEQGVELEAWQMTGPAGYQFVLGYGGQFQAPTLDFVAGEKNVIGNIVGTYNDLAELMVLAQAGKVTLHTRQYPLDSALDALHDLDAGQVRGRAILVP
jgi:NAD+-dependent secondary alcohol dehydrogenase Adh1